MTHDTNALGQAVGREVPNWSDAQLPTGEPLDGRYCRLERLDPDRHVAALFEANSVDVLGANWTYLPYGPYASILEYQAWVADVAAQVDPLFFAVLDRSTNRAVGVASYLRAAPADGSIEVGHINFSPALQRTRASTEAMYLMMARVFDDWGYRRYEWKCDSLNEPSMSAARRLGFTHEGTHRNAKIVKGRNRDTVWFSITDDEWPAIKHRLQQWLAPENFDDAGRQRVELGPGARESRPPSADGQ